MDPIPNPEEMLFMSGLSGNAAGPSCDKEQAFDWPPQESELQYNNLTSRGPSNSPHTAAGTSVHPLVPLLLYSDRLLPLSSPYSQPINEPVTRRVNPSSWTRPCYHSDGVPGRTNPRENVKSQDQAAVGSTVYSRQSVKKPLNAFMLYMKETRHQVLQEGREKESSAVNRILGRRWHALPRSEQSKYYELAQKERLLHMQLYPGWSARDNYGKRKKKPLGGSSSRLEVICSRSKSCSP